MINFEKGKEAMMADSKPREPSLPKGKAVGDEDPDYSPMDTMRDNPPMTARGADGRAHKVEELKAPTPNRSRKRSVGEGIPMPARLRGNPD